MDDFEFDIADPRVHDAKFRKKGYGPDFPAFHEALSGLDADKYIEGVKVEITKIKCMNNWILVPVDREPHMKVL